MIFYTIIGFKQSNSRQYWINLQLFSTATFIELKESHQSHASALKTWPEKPPQFQIKSVKNLLIEHDKLTLDRLHKIHKKIRNECCWWGLTVFWAINLLRNRAIKFDWDILNDHKIMDWLFEFSSYIKFLFSINHKLKVMANSPLLFGSKL